MTELRGLPTHSEYGLPAAEEPTSIQPQFSGPRPVTTLDEQLAIVRAEAAATNPAIEVLHKLGGLLVDYTYYSGLDRLIPRPRRSK